jgi:DeoR family transcriptional regulator, fructose operon transcriptional repressor
MFIEERLNKILKLLEENGRVTVKEAIQFLDVSADTIRRDFSQLAEKGLVFRTHGGIMSKESVSFDPGMAEKVVQHRSEKELIAKKAAGLVHDSEVIIIDPGTTTEGIVKYLGENKNLTILTNALNIAVESTRRGINTIIMGGVIRQSTLSIIGPDAIEMIKHYQADKLFMGVSGISISKGLMTPNRMEAEIKKELIKVANQTIIVADHSKLHKTALCSFGSLEDIDVFVTDKDVDQELMKRLQEYEIEVVLAD